MKTVTLENGRKVQISDESHDALEKASRKRWKPEEDQQYWCINSWGVIIPPRWQNESGHFFRYQNRNVFPSEKEAQAALDRINKRNEILDRIEELNEGWEPDWSDFDQDKHWMTWDREDNQFFIAGNIISKSLPDRYYLKSESIGHQLIEEFEDDLKVLFV